MESVSRAVAMGTAFLRDQLVKLMRMTICSGARSELEPLGTRSREDFQKMFSKV